MRKKIARWKGKIKEGIYPTCILCGKPITEVKELTTEHLIPLSRGGNSHDSNIFCAHFKCNQEKGNKTYLEWLVYLSQKQRSRG